MLQIIHLSQVGCFTPARGKAVQKNREVNGVNGHSIGSTVSDAIVRSWLWSTATRSSPLSYWVITSSSW